MNVVGEINCECCDKCRNFNQDFSACDLVGTDDEEGMFSLCLLTETIRCNRFEDNTPATPAADEK